MSPNASSSYPLSSAPAASPAGTLTVLVADDSRIDRRIVASILEGRGHRVLAAGDGTSALALFRENEGTGVVFDAAVLDFQMPGLGGEDLAQALRVDEGKRIRPLRIVLLSGAAEERTGWKGIDAALPKPLDPEALLAAIEGRGAGKVQEPPANIVAVLPVPSDPPAEEGSERVVFDLPEALKRARGKQALLVELVKIFMDDSGSYLETLHQAAAAGNLEQVERAAHRLKGSSANVSAQRAAAAAERIEKTVRATHALPEAALLSSLDDEVGKSRRALSGFLAQNQV